MDGLRHRGKGVRWVALLLALSCGCASLQQQPITPELPPVPSKKQVRLGPFLFLSDVDLNKKEHAALLKELQALPEQVYQELHLPFGQNVIYVYLFKDRAKYEEYMGMHFRDLPTRRAFFMARSDERRGDELMVYTYWGDRVREDLRHELTHALLHSVLKDVPMWLDEGLAEYFEVPAESQGLNYRHLSSLRGVPWTPNLPALEKLTQVKEMTPADYREAWAWVHFMLKSSPQTKAVLLSYLQDLRQRRDIGPLEPRLAAAVTSPENAVRLHIAKLEAATQTLAGAP
jgi:hypothetical protein